MCLNVTTAVSFHSEFYCFERSEEKFFFNRKSWRNPDCLLNWISMISRAHENSVNALFVNINEPNNSQFSFIVTFCVHCQLPSQQILQTPGYANKKCFHPHFFASRYLFSKEGPKNNVTEKKPESCSDSEIVAFALSILLVTKIKFSIDVLA